MSAREPGRVRESERGEGCWLTLGQCWRGAVAFGSWLWRVHNAYCRATHHTNVCADAFTQRPALTLYLYLVRLLSLHRYIFVSAEDEYKIFLPKSSLSSFSYYSRFSATPIRYVKNFFLSDVEEVVEDKSKTDKTER